MAYLVLARKYRPQSFSEVYAQDHVTKILQNTIEMSRIAHAYLFTGPRGVGKTSMARIFAKSLNCSTNGPSPNPCNSCQNCIEITQGISSDVIEIDGASNTSVDDIRDIQKELMYSTNTSLYKIYIIDEVHMLSKNAFNALLKTLEEPPKNVIFIFATTEPHKVLPTIISRCQRYDFKRIPIPAIVDRLKYIASHDNITIDGDGLFLIAKKADGSMRDALSLMDQVLSFGGTKIDYDQILNIFGIVDFDVYKKVLDAILNKDSTSIINVLHDILEKGNDIQEFINGLMDYIRSVMLLKVGINIEDVSPEIKSGMQPFTEQFSENELLYLISMLIKTKTDIKTSNNPLLIAEMSFLKLAKLAEIKPLEELIKDFSENPQIKDTKIPHGKKESVKSRIQNLHKKTAEVKKELKKEAEAEKPEFKEFNLDVYNQFIDKLSERIKNKRPFLASFFNKTTVDKIVSNTIHLNCPDEITYERLNRKKSEIETTISEFFGFNLRIILKIKETKKNDIISNPTIDDIREKSPDLADFIDVTETSFTH